MSAVAATLAADDSLAALLPRLAALDLAVERVLGAAVAPGGGRRRSTHRGAGAEFRGHRAYTPGDELRYVDWNAMARLGVPYVKEFETEEALRLVVCLDQTASVDPALAVFARRVAAVLGYLALSRHDGVDLHAVPGGGAGDPLAGRARGAEWLARLDALTHGGRGTLAEAARRLRCPEGKGLVTYVTDGWDLDDLGAALDGCRRRRLAVAVAHVVAPPLLDGPDGPVRVYDAETGRHREIRLSAGLRTRYRLAVERHWDAVRGACRRKRVPYARCDRRQDLEDIVFGALVKGGVLR
jgi:uncharacterized protein (DUF58 family)